jgi:hypothetical protein
MIDESRGFEVKRSDPIDPVQPRFRRAAFAKTALGSLAFGMVVVMVWKCAELGSINAAYSALIHPYPLQLSGNLNFGTLPAKDHAKVTLAVRNCTGKPITINGIQSYCIISGCISSHEAFPITVPGEVVRNLTIDVKLPNSPGQATRLESTLYTSVGPYPFVVQGRCEN